MVGFIHELEQTNESKNITPREPPKHKKKRIRAGPFMFWYIEATEVCLIINDKIVSMN